MKALSVPSGSGCFAILNTECCVSGRIEASKKEDPPCGRADSDLGSSYSLPNSLLFLSFSPLFLILSRQPDNTILIPHFTFLAFLHSLQDHSHSLIPTPLADHSAFVAVFTHTKRTADIPGWAGNKSLVSLPSRKRASTVTTMTEKATNQQRDRC